MKIRLIAEDACGTDGSDPSKVYEIYQVIDDDGFQHTIRVQKGSKSKNLDVTQIVNKAKESPIITI